MQRFNLLPRATFFERHKWSLMVCTASLSVALAAGGLFYYLGVVQSSLGPAVFTPKKGSQLSKYAVSRLKMIGYLAKTANHTTLQSLSLIQSPDGQVVVLQVGEKLGNEGLEIVAIKSSGTYLASPQQSEPIVLRASFSSPYE